MSRGAFRQADMERIFRAARNEGTVVQIDLRSLVVTAFPGIHTKGGIDTTKQQEGILSGGDLAPDGKENWDEN